MLFRLWAKDRDKLLILSLGHPSPFQSASYWAVFCWKTTPHGFIQLHVFMKFLLLTYTRERRLEGSLRTVLNSCQRPIHAPWCWAWQSWELGAWVRVSVSSTSTKKWLESEPSLEEWARSVIPLGLFAFIFPCWKQKWITLFTEAMRQREMMQLWSRGTKKKGPLCKPSSSLCSGLRRG